MPVVLLLERGAVYDVNARIVGVEESRYKDVGGRLRWELRKDLGLGCRFLLAVQKCRARRMLIAVAGLVPFQLLVVLLLVFVEVVLDFRQLNVVSRWSQNSQMVGLAYLSQYCIPMRLRCKYCRIVVDLHYADRLGHGLHLALVACIFFCDRLGLSVAHPTGHVSNVILL
jgi:hypothetical protein